MFILRDSTINSYFQIQSNPNRFPDNTLALGKIGNTYDEIMWLYDGDDELFTLMCLREHTKRTNVFLIMPYIPHARMDRTEDEEVFTLKTFCQAINNMNFSSVTVADPHSNVSAALLDRVQILSPVRYINEAFIQIAEHQNIHLNPLFQNFALFYPDEGAMKRYSKMFPEIPYAFGMKNRDWKTGKINGLTIMNSDLVQGKTVLIVDDICSRGGTFYHASKALDAAGASSIYLYVTHCENTVFSGDMYKGKLVKQIYTTDSILHTREDSKVKTVYSFMGDFQNGKVF